MSTPEEKLRQKTIFLEAFKGLLNSEKHSDVTLYLGPNELKFPAHYAILSTRTKYFDTAKEKGFKEGVENEFRFKDNSAHALYRVLQYIYTGDYSVDNNQLDDDNEDDRELIKHPRVHAIADLWDIPDLKKLSETRFEQQLREHWISDTFVDSVREVYSSTAESDRGMRDSLAGVARKNITSMFAKEDFKKLISENAEFSGDLVKLLVESPVPGSGTRTCRHCGYTL